MTAVLAQARRLRATEVLIETSADGARVRLRIDGVLHQARPLTANEADALREALPELAADPACEVVTLPTRDGDAIAIRVRDPSEPSRTIGELGLDDDRVAQAHALLSGRHGAVVVTGPAGAGVTTTLHALLGEVTAPEVHAVAVEHPIERTLAGVTQVVVPPDLPMATAVRRAIESRPDALLIGDVRDGATAVLALDSALTGGLVLAGLVGRDAAAVPGRLLAMGLEPVVIGSALRGLIAQRLARRLCETCKEPWTPSDAELEATGWDDPDEVPALFRPVGCEACGGIGYRGVVLVAEILTMSDELAQLIAGRANASDIQKVAITQGMQPLRRAALTLARAGVTSLAEVVRVT